VAQVSATDKAATTATLPYMPLPWKQNT
jgi:hypothetical protein